jgi:hypothetical protein
MLKKYVGRDARRQLAAVYAVQVFSHQHHFPKGAWLVKGGRGIWGAGGSSQHGVWLAGVGWGMGMYGL